MPELVEESSLTVAEWLQRVGAWPKNAAQIAEFAQH